MNITKIIIVFLLIITIIILLNKKNINEHLTESEEMDKFFLKYENKIKTFIQQETKPNTILNIPTIKLLNSKVNQYMYLPNTLGKNDQNIIWLNLKDKKDNGWGPTTGETIKPDYNTSQWNSKNIYQLTNNKNQTKDKGIIITVPPYIGDVSGLDYSVLWVQTRGDIFSSFMISDGTTIFGKYAAGYNKLNKINPNGGIHNDISPTHGSGATAIRDVFEWYPVPIKLNSSRELIVSNPSSVDDTWYSGFAFSTNPWNHCKVSARTVHLNMNKDDATSSAPHTDISWNNISWNDIPLAQINKNTTPSFRIPFVNSGSNKIFYIIDYNQAAGQYISNININNTDIGSLYTTFNNPFSRHFNSRRHHRYNGIVIPKEILPENDNFLTVKITMLNNSNEFYFTECGTHDENPFNSTITYTTTGSTGTTGSTPTTANTPPTLDW